MTTPAVLQNSPATGANAQPGTVGQKVQRSQGTWSSCVQFESLFLHKLLQEMRQSVDSSGGVIPMSNGLRTAYGMLDERLADTLGQTAQAGVAAAMYQRFAASDHLQPLAQVREATQLDQTV